ncbi:hypothetical protein KC842_01920 [Candidatus Nomurabacteria bacterium]|nr:hypothetical protein [Candidatus Nomurabacteria bacterium]
MKKETEDERFNRILKSVDDFYKKNPQEAKESIDKFQKNYPQSTQNKGITAQQYLEWATKNFRHKRRFSFFKKLFR